MRPALRSACLALALGCVHVQASADGPTSNAAVAQRLYDEAKAAMSAEHYAQACAMFAESHRLDPATGGTLLNLAVCHEKQGKVATASAEFEEAAALARHFGRSDREELARSHLDALRPHVSTLALSISDTANVPGLALTLDGVEIGRAAWGGIPVDPGEHVVDVTAPGKVPSTLHVTIGTDKEMRTISIAALADTPQPVVAPPTAPPPAPRPAALSPSPPNDGTGSRRTSGFIVAGLGVAATGIGAAFGISALSTNFDSKNECAHGCTARGADDSRTALFQANVANVGIGVGLVALALGTYLVATSHGASHPVVSASSAGGVVGWGGSW